MKSIKSSKGKKNSFGSFGISEQKLSGTALGALFSSAQAFFKLVNEGDLRAQNILENFIMDLSILIANAVSLLNPEKTILSGGVSKSLSNYLESICSQVRELTPIPSKIEIGQLGDAGAAIGAAGYALNRTK